MPLCVKCKREVCNPCLRGSSLGERQRIVVASDDELTRLSCFRRMAMATASLVRSEGISRRRFPDWLADTIYGYEGEIVWAHGGAFTISDTAIDDAFNNDGSFRWLWGFVRFADETPRQAPQQRVLARLRLIELAFQIAKPDIARHFRR